MALNVKDIVRKFEFKKDGDTIKLDDPNPNFTPDEVMSFYANTYPELTTATVFGPKMENDVAQYEFKTTVGTKG